MGSADGDGCREHTEYEPRVGNVVSSRQSPSTLGELRWVDTRCKPQMEPKVDGHADDGDGGDEGDQAPRLRHPFSGSPEWDQREAVDAADRDLVELPPPNRRWVCWRKPVGLNGRRAQGYVTVGRFFLDRSQVNR